ncbi:MAG: type II secretion system protein [Candidatus Moranbacteria bacterium]|nr:type II secretion system protein [Candidatus Moranbacteria bacterium]
MKKTNKKGFTLIELLVVVAIIAILAGIVLVSLNSARDRSRKASLQSTLASIMPTAAMCVNDGGSIQNPTSATTGGNDICDLSDIDEVWPALTHITGASYQYRTTGGTSITAGDAIADIVVCSVSSGSCTLQ